MVIIGPGEVGMSGAIDEYVCIDKLEASYFRTGRPRLSRLRPCNPSIGKRRDSQPPRPSDGNAYIARRCFHSGRVVASVDRTEWNADDPAAAEYPIGVRSDGTAAKLVESG